MCTNLASAGYMHGLDKVDCHLPYLACLPNGTPNAQCCCPRCNYAKGTYSLASHAEHMILQLRIMQDPAFRAKYGLPPQPLCMQFYIPSTESESESEPYSDMEA
jgi:hypothetical protein